jgi:hypothetical protein
MEAVLMARLMLKKSRVSRTFRLGEVLIKIRLCHT